MDLKLNQLQKKINYQFQDITLLEHALTHRSFKGKNNERLEFLGDGILNFLIAESLFHKFPNLPEGDLSRLRSDLVKSKTLSDIALKFELGEYIKLGEGELKSAGWRRPSILADCMEAILAAVFLDSGLDASRSMIKLWFHDLIKNIDPKKIEKDPKSILQELLQAQKIDRPSYEVINISGEAHAQHFEVTCTIDKLDISTQGEGSSRKVAEQMAASSAIKLFKRKAS